MRQTVHPKNHVLRAEATVERDGAVTVHNEAMLVISNSVGSAPTYRSRRKLFRIGCIAAAQNRSDV
jgi:hypothetical protein